MESLLSPQVHRACFLPNQRICSPPSTSVASVTSHSRFNSTQRKRSAFNHPSTRCDVHRTTAHTIMAAASDRTASGAQASSSDLLVVGPGVLGSYLGKRWLDGHQGAQVVGQTNTENSHDRLRQLGITPRTKAAADGTKFANVVFCAPPSGSADYPAEVRTVSRGMLRFFSPNARAGDFVT